MVNENELSKTTRYLHWITATLILGVISIGFYMVTTEAWGLYNWHKSFGLIAVLLIVLRMVYRLKRGWPDPVTQYSRHEQLASKIVHWVLLVGILLLPLTGMLYSGSSGHGFGVFDWTLMPVNQGESGVVPHSEALAFWAKRAHSWLGFGLAFVIALHLLGALKHHFLDRDNTLRRMLGRPGPTTHRKDCKLPQPENKGKVQ